MPLQQALNFIHSTSCTMIAGASYEPTDETDWSKVEYGKRVQEMKIALIKKAKEQSVLKDYWLNKPVTTENKLNTLSDSSNDAETIQPLTYLFLRKHPIVT